MENVAVAYSGGVDSTLLLKIVYDIKDDKAIGIYADSPLQPERERLNAQETARIIGARMLIINNRNLLDSEAFRKNPRDRCYFCKGFLFDEIVKTARSLGYTVVLDGSNHDDREDFRPGEKALRERNIRSPLQEAGLTKEEIRIISKKYGLPTWNKDAYACLASRIPYDEEITEEKLRQVDEVEQILIKNGYRNVRARYYGKKVRIEVRKDQVDKLKEEIKDKNIIEVIIGRGFTKIEIDPAGYCQGSLNKPLNS